MTFLVGDPVTADSLNDVLDLFPVIYKKSSATARNTTTTLADDPDLASIALAVGTYEIELVLFWTQTTTATQKIKTRWIFSGTWGTPLRACIGAGSAQTAAPSAATEATVCAYTASGQDAVYCQAAGGTYGVAREVAGSIVVTVAGNLSFQWAQVASSGNNTTVQSDTFFRIRKVA